MEDNKELLLSSHEDCEWWAKEFCSMDGFSEALALVEKSGSKDYVKPEDAEAVITGLIERCDRVVAKHGWDWYEDYEKCFYIHYSRHVNADGSINRNVTLNITVGGWFMAG